MLKRSGLALGCIRMGWRHIRVMFIPKRGKYLSQAKSLRPISLMSLVLKTLEKLLARHARDGVLVENPLHHNNYACRDGVSSETAFFQVVGRLENFFTYKEVALGVLLDTEGAFHNISFNAIITAARELRLEEICC
jgi:hypothetical protein